MACEHFDLKAYLLGELSPQEGAAVERHLETSNECRRELEQLRLTMSMLRALPELEPPRRVQFVSDKVFEPSWWQRFWNSGPRLGFASAALVAMAIFTHAFYRPTTAPQVVPGFDPSAFERRVKMETDARIDSAVRNALTAAEKQQAEKLLVMVGELEKRIETRRQADLLAAEDYLNAIRKQMSTMYLASADFRSAR